VVPTFTPTLSPSLFISLAGDLWFTAQKALSQVLNLSQQQLELKF
jgi:hypothetical protein